MATAARAAVRGNCACLAFDGAGNLTADPAGAYKYNGAQQMATATLGGKPYTYKYAGAAQNELLSQTTPKGTYQLTYGRTDAQGLPVIEQLKKDNLTAYVKHDPVTGEPLMLRTNTGMQSLYVYDGTGNPAALLTSGEYVAFAYTYDPYGQPTLTENSGDAGVPQNPYTFKVGLQDRATGWVKYGQRWYSPGIGRWTQMDTLDTPLDPKNANRYAYAANDPINNADPLGLMTGCAPTNSPACLGGGVPVPPVDDSNDSFVCRLSVMSWAMGPLTIYAGPATQTGLTFAAFVYGPVSMGTAPGFVDSLT